MKRFRYSLETVLHYKNQVLDNLKAEHAAAMERVNRKEEEIRSLEGRLGGFQKGFDAAKVKGAPIETFRLYDMCISGAEKQIDGEKERLALLLQRENEKKEQVLVARVDTSRYEKLKERRLAEYHTALGKEEERFAEEFITRSMVRTERREERVR